MVRMRGSRQNKCTATLSVGEEGGGGGGQRLERQKQHEQELAVVVLVLGGLHAGLGLMEHTIFLIALDAGRCFEQGGAPCVLK